jgi:hypothetical protein
MAGSSLIDANIRSLRQVLELLERIDERTYGEPPPGFVPHRVGGHLRHILEFYECFLDGIEPRAVDYDARRRDASIEKSPRAAMARIREIIARLENTPALRDDCVLRIRVEEAPGAFVVSSAGRELQVLSSHTIHHFALIAVTLRAHGVDVDRDFGMAPSTLRYLRKRNAA